MKGCCSTLLALASLAGASLAQPASSFFVPNQGQWEGDFLFRYQGPGVGCFITQTGMTLDLREYERLPRREEFDPFQRRHEPPEGTVRGHVLRLSYVNAGSSPEFIGEEKLESYSNYFLGRDSCRWRSFVPHYERVVAKEVWPGIDVEYLAHEDGVETLFRVKPGADVSQIALEFEGLDRPLEVDAQGNLLLHTSLGAVKEKAPWAYQIIGSRRIEVPVSFRILSSTRYGLILGQHDDSQELVIDPRVIYSSCFGAGGGVTDISLDSEGNLVMVGSTSDPEFPVTPGAYQDTIRGSGDAYLSKLRPDGHSLAYSTYMGGIAGSEQFLEVVVDAQDRMMAGGGTYGPDWPLTEGAFDTVMVGPEPVFVCFSADGSQLLYSSFVGGSGIDFIWDLAWDTLSGEVYACGQAGEDFPLTPDAVYPEPVGSSSAVWIFDPSVMQIVYSTYFPAAQADGNVPMSSVLPVGDRVVWLAGAAGLGAGMITADAFQPDFGGGSSDGYLVECDLRGPGVTYGTYLGGSGNDACHGVMLTSPNRLVLRGVTRSTDFPVTPGAFDTSYGGWDWDVFISVLVPPQTLLYSTYFGGGWADESYGGAVSHGGDVIVAGHTEGVGFPYTADAFDTVAEGGGFLCKLSLDLSHLLFSTRWGGVTGQEAMGEILVEGRDSIWVDGVTHSWDYPATEDAIQPCEGWDGYIAHFYIGPDSGTGSTRPTGLMPDDLTLTCYPNPFNATAVLRFTLPRAGSARLLVYDLLGRVVLDENLGRMPAGEHGQTLDASDLPSGIYFARLEALGLERVQKMVILR